MLAGSSLIGEALILCIFSVLLIGFFVQFMGLDKHNF